jgi:hypothetical protein
MKLRLASSGRLHKEAYPWQKPPGGLEDLQQWRNKL